MYLMLIVTSYLTYLLSHTLLASVQEHNTRQLKNTDPLPTKPLNSISSTFAHTCDYVMDTYYHANIWPDLSSPQKCDFAHHFYSAMFWEFLVLPTVKIPSQTSSQSMS